MAVVTSHPLSGTEPEEGVEVQTHTYTGTISDADEEMFVLEGENPEPERRGGIFGRGKWAWAAVGILLTLCVVLLSGGGTYTYRVVASKTQGAKNVDVAASIEDEVEEDCDEDVYGSRRRKLNIDSGEDDDDYMVF